MTSFTCRRFILVCAAAAAFVAADAVSLGAQQPDTAAARRLAEEQLGRSLSTGEILERIRASGLSRGEAHERLRQLGYDPALVDPYYDSLEQGGSPLQTTRSDASFARALESLKRAPRFDLTDTVEVDAAREEESIRSDSAGLPLFGLDLFTGATSEFQPVQYGPVDSSYRLGPGDEVLLVLTGGVETAYSLEVNRQGYIAVPDVGQLPVTGMTLDQLETALRQYIGRVYEGIRGPEPTIQLQVSLGRLRTNQVYIVGEVARPGAYQVSAVATAFNALYRAGGPTRNGSFRNIRVWRGDRVVQVIDLYDYLLSGDSRNDIRLENGDRIHVPLPGPRSAVEGKVRRPGIYELTPGESLDDLLLYAGGFEPDAVVRRIQVDRILPPAERRPGVDRVLLDVDLADLLGAQSPEVPVRDGDVVRVFAVSSDRKHRVTLTGAVRRPGTYEWSSHLTLGELFARAEGLSESAYEARAHIFRLDETTGQRRLLSVEIDGQQGASERTVLADRDSVVVYSRVDLRTPQLVRVEGYVKEPGTYPLAQDMTVEDLILTAGGFSEGAFTGSVEVARTRDTGTRNDTTAVVLTVPIGTETGGRLMEGGGVPRSIDSAGVLPGLAPGPDEFELRHDDRVFVRQDPGYREPQTVVIHGEVAFPGEYVLARRNERLMELIARAGGLTADAHVAGIHVLRAGKPVALDAAEALRDPSGPPNLVLEGGDSLQVPSYDPTVLVLGAVSFESRVLYRPGADLSYYIEQAGGYQELADVKRTTVTRQNGERKSSQAVLMYRSSPEVTPGSVIEVPLVPAQERNGINWGSVLSRAATLASVTATLLLAINQM